MIVDVLVPEVGESITEGVLQSWLAEDGAEVAAGSDLFELETDKVTMAVPAEVPGRLAQLVPAGSVVRVGQAVARIDTSLAERAAEPIETPLPPRARPVTAVPPTVPPVVPPAGMPQARAKLAQEIVLSPAARRLVEQHGVDAGSITATGKDGRVTKEDVLQEISRAARAPVPKAVPAAPEGMEMAPPVLAPRETRRKMSPLRQRIAERLLEARQSAAILSTFNEVDMSAVIAVRAKYRELFEKRFDVRLGFMSFFVKAVVDALKTVPALNVRVEGDEIVEQHFFDIGVAVSTEQGLLVPVLRNADQLGFGKIEAEITRLAERARNRALTLPELQGGCFTISNGGIFGSLLSTPILNPPQSGILGLHRVQKRAVVVDDQIVIRPMMYLALSYDHRVVDGAGAVTFLKRVVECVEDPERMLLEV